MLAVLPMRSRRFSVNSILRTPKAHFASQTTQEALSNGVISRYERDFLRRSTNAKLDPQRHFEGTIDRKIACPIIGTFNYAAAKKSDMLKKTAFEEGLTGGQLAEWTNAKQAASILHIPADEVPGITTGNIDKFYHTFLQQNGMLTAAGYAEAVRARDVLTNYTSTELFLRQTKAHFARLVSKERLELSEDFSNIWGENIGIFVRIFALFFLLCSCLLVFTIARVFLKEPGHMDKLYDIGSRIISRAFSVRNPRESTEYVEVEKSSDVYVDETILGGSFKLHGEALNTHRGHAVLPSMDPVYAELVEDAAETLHKERQHVMRILERRLHITTAIPPK